jgi:diadenylate cyclase
MLEGFLHLFTWRSGKALLDVADILLVTYVIYRALLVLRGTRAMQMGFGLGVIFLVYVVSKWAGFITLFNLLNALLSSIILVVVVVFQNDIRRGLMRVGSRAFVGGLARQQESKVIDEVVAAATELARHRIGALIAFEQDANLEEFVVGQGTPIDASVQRELLVSLFLPDNLNKLHDGAVVIRNLRVAKAGVFFPMPDTKLLDKSLGSRHRAALGITEETDAVVVVVSEERGSISFCFNGNIVTNLDGASLRQALLGLFGQRVRKRPVKTAAKRTTGTVTQTSTGSFRVTIPPPPSGSLEGREGAHSARSHFSSSGDSAAAQLGRPHFSPSSDSASAPSARSHFLPSLETTAPRDGRDSTPPKSEKDAASLLTRPMAAAKPIETPPASKIAQIPGPPTGPREE